MWADPSAGAGGASLGRGGPAAHLAVTHRERPQVRGGCAGAHGRLLDALHGTGPRAAGSGSGSSLGGAGMPSAQGRGGRRPPAGGALGLGLASEEEGREGSLGTPHSLLGEPSSPTQDSGMGLRGGGLWPQPPSHTEQSP